MLYGFFLIVLFFVVFAIVRAFKLNFKWLSRITIFFLSASILPIIIALITWQGMANTRLICTLFLISGVLLVSICVLIIFLKKSTRNDKIVLSIAPLIFAGTGFLYFLLNKEFGREIIYRKKICEGIYFNVCSKKHSQANYCVVTLENWLFIKQNCYPYNYTFGWWEDMPSEFRFVSLKDSVLKFSVSFKEDSVLRFPIRGSVNELEVDLRFEHVDPPYNGVRKVLLRNKYGAIDENGKVIIPPEYEFMSEYSGGLVLAKKNNKMGYIDRNNKIIIPFKFDGGGGFNGDSAGVRIDNVGFYINKKGEITSKQK